MITDRILAATAHWLNGEPEAAAAEELEIVETMVVGDSLVITYQPADGVPFLAMWKCTAVELQTSALRRASDGSRAG
jgi:hypothetical protein